MTNAGELGPDALADPRSLHRTIPVLLIGEFVARIKGLLFIPFLTRYFVAGDYGAWTQSSVLSALVLPIAMLGTDSAVARLLPAMDAARRRRAFSGWLLFLVAAGGLMAGLLILGRHPLGDLLYESGKFENLVTATALGIVATLVLNACRTWFRVQRQTTALSVVVSAQAVLAIVAVVAVLLTNGGLVALILATTAADIVVTAGVLVWFAAKGVLVRPDFSALPVLVRFGLPLLPAGYGIWGLNWIDRLVIVRHEALASVGVYSLAYGIAYFAVQMVTNPVWLLFPSSAAELHDTGRTDELRLLAKRSLSLMVFATVPFIAMAFPLGREALRVVSPAEYSAGSLVLPLVMIGYLVLMLNGHYEISVGLVHRQWLATAGIGTGFAVNAIANLVLVPTMGINGAAWATVAGFSAQWAFVSRSARSQGIVRLDLPLTVRLVASSVACGLVAWGVRELVPGRPVVDVVAAGIAGLLAYLTVAAALRALPIAEVRGELARFRPTSASGEG